MKPTEQRLDDALARAEAAERRVEELSYQRSQEVAIARADAAQVEATLTAARRHLKVVLDEGREFHGVGELILAREVLALLDGEGE